MNQGEFRGRIRDYRLMQAKGIVEQIEAENATLPREPERREATAHLIELRGRIRALDLSTFGWPPMSESEGGNDLLHSDEQRLVSAVIRFDHIARTAKVLRYVLKERP